MLLSRRNGRFRAECLNAHWFLSLADAREKMEDWRNYYNVERPHGGHTTPTYGFRCQSAMLSRPGSKGYRAA
jgi:putative transposase